MITVETIHSSKNKISAHCGDCWKILDSEEEGLDPLGEDAVQFMMSVAERHVRKHPTHNPVVYVYQKEVLIPEA